MLFFTKASSMLCIRCHREATVEYRTLVQKLRNKVRFCPFCGSPLSNFDETDLAAEGYEWEQEAVKQ